MLHNSFLNFCVLFTFAILIYVPFQNKLNIFTFHPRFTPFIIGALSGVTGCLLIMQTIIISNNTVVDGRLAVIVFSGILGGPIAPILSSIIIGVFRIFAFDISQFSIIAGMNTVVIGFVIGFLTIKNQMTFRNSAFYFTYAILQTTFVIGFLNNWTSLALNQIIIFLIFSALSFSILYFILNHLSNLFTQIKQIEEMSGTDYLTGLYNNRKFQEITQKLIDESPGFSLILLDVDHFKRVNDQYGHPIGDEVLKQLSLRLKESAKAFNGIVSRNGGEEFSVLIPNASEKDSTIAADIIRHDVEQKEFLVSTGELLKITISCGISTSPNNGLVLHDLYILADKALYHAKESGRNRVFHINKT